MSPLLQYGKLKKDAALTARTASAISGWIADY